MAQTDFQQRLQSVERLLGEIDRGADPGLREGVRQLVEAVMGLHGAALDRMVTLARDAGGGLIERFTEDELVESLLVLHGLHPLGLEARIERGVEKARARLRPHRGEVELIGIENGDVRLRLHAHGHGCGSAAEALKEVVEDALYRSAPDLASLVIETEEKRSFVPVTVLEGAV